MMKIFFGPYDYELVPRSPIDTGTNYMSIQILANEINLDDLAAILKNKNNLKDIRIIEGENIQYYTEYNKLDSLQKKYDVVYNVRYEEQIISPERIDPNTHEVIPARINVIPVEDKTDIIYIRLNKKSAIDQINENAANIEFIAIMSDIEL